MYARTVTIAGRSIAVTCVPETPLADVLRRAAFILENYGFDPLPQPSVLLPPPSLFTPDN